MASNPRRISEIRVDMTIMGSYTEEEKSMLELTALNCPVAKTLHPEVLQHFTFSWQAA
jgi:uncharacterized OsmC-like protein